MYLLFYFIRFSNVLSASLSLFILTTSVTPVYLHVCCVALCCVSFEKVSARFETSSLLTVIWFVSMFHNVACVSMCRSGHRSREHLVAVVSTRTPGCESWTFTVSHTVKRLRLPNLYSTDGIIIETCNPSNFHRIVQWRKISIKDHSSRCVTRCNMNALLWWDSPTITWFIPYTLTVNFKYLKTIPTSDRRSSLEN